MTTRLLFPLLLPALSITAALHLPAQEKPLVFAAIGDFGAHSIGNGPQEKKVADLVKSWDPAFILTLGDNNYPKGRAERMDDNIGQYYSAYIGNYHGKYEPKGVESRFFPTLGNHDWGDDDPNIKPANVQPHLDYFTLPGNERYYSVDKGVVNLFALDSFHKEPDGVKADSVQGLWLKEALKNSNAVWKIVYFHHAPYSSGTKHGADTHMRWPFKEWGASVVLSGHEHNYEHVLVDGLHFFVNGLGGDGIYKDIPLKNGKPDPKKLVPGSQFQYTTQHGAMKLEATSKTLKISFITIDGQVPEPPVVLSK